MRLSGRTPLVRALNLEKQLKVKNIYLKLEGTNPTHHKYARIAEALCKDVAIQKKKTIWLDGSRAYLVAVKHFCDIVDANYKVPRFTRQSWKKSIFRPEELVDMRQANVTSRYEAIKGMIQPDTDYLAIEGHTHHQMIQASLEEIAEEIFERLTGIDAIYAQCNLGYTLNGIYNVFLKKWIKGDVKLPEIFLGIGTDMTDPENRVSGECLDYIIKDKELAEVRTSFLEENPSEKIPVTVEELWEAKKMLKNLENIYISTENAYPMAAFLRQVENRMALDKIHVIILNDARSRITIKEIEDLDDEEFKDVLGYVKQYLAQYSDPEIEMADALANALDKGFVLIAEQDGENMGVCIIVNTQFKTFIPTYHLAYLGTSRKARGMGIGTELVKQAIEKTNGKLSLHVDLDNRNARKLYEKMGFRHVYNRMIYKSDNE